MKNKVVVPKFVAEWFEQHKDNLEQAIIELSNIVYQADFPFPLDIEEWFANANNNPIKTLLRMEEGYTIQEERWAVAFQKHETTFFFSNWDSISSFIPVGCLTITNDYIARFTDKKKAQALADLIDGNIVLCPERGV